MAPWSCWSEWATGTNGMGTALEAPGPVLISGPEHWCRASTSGSVPAWPFATR